MRERGERVHAQRDLQRAVWQARQVDAAAETAVHQWVTEEAEQAVSLLSSHQDAIWANLAGHLHVDTSMDWERAGIEVHVTDATWDDVNRVRIVNVSANEHRFSFNHWVEDID